MAYPVQIQSSFRQFRIKHFRSKTKQHTALGFVSVSSIHNQTNQQVVFKDQGQFTQQKSDELKWKLYTLKGTSCHVLLRRCKKLK